MKLIEALEIALELCERGEINSASQEVRDTIYIGCASTEPDLFHFLFSDFQQQALDLLPLTEEGKNKIRKGPIKMIQKEIDRVKMTSLS